MVIQRPNNQSFHLFQFEWISVPLNCNMNTQMVIASEVEVNYQYEKLLVKYWHVKFVLLIQLMQYALTICRIIDCNWNFWFVLTISDIVQLYDILISHSNFYHYFTLPYHKNWSKTFQRKIKLKIILTNAILLLLY